MDIVLIGGLWLDGSAWDAVVPALEAVGHRPVPVILPGQGDGSASATLADQVTAALAAVDATAGRPMVVGHSAACTLAWLAVDARPEKVARVVLVGGFPAGDGKPYADMFEVENGVVPFPGWEPFEGPDAAELDEAARRRRRARARPGRAHDLRRHRLRPLADDHPAGRARPAPRRGGGRRLTGRGRPAAVRRRPGRRAGPR